MKKLIKALPFTFLVACNNQSKSQPIKDIELNNISKEEVEKVAGELGSRKNPAKIGETIFVKGENIADIEITLTDVMRGEEVEKIVMKENQFNEPPKDGYEFILAKFKFKNIKNLSEKDIPLEVNYSLFSFSNKDFKKTNEWNLNVIPDFLNGELYEGAETEGWILFDVEKNDENPYAIAYNEVWFSLVD